MFGVQVIKIFCLLVPFALSRQDPKLHGIFLDEKVAPRIVGGTESIKGRYPYQVALVRNRFQFCAGTLISKQYVLSAAHCHGYVTHIHIGIHDFSNKTETYSRIRVEKEIKHPRYKRNSFEFDFMLIKLKEAVPSYFIPVKLDNGSLRLSQHLDLTVMGWGSIGFSEESSDVLLEVEVDYIPQRECRERYAKGGEKITTSMLCAARHGKDSCQGDSGGPLIKKGATSDEDIQVGIVSWGFDCADCRFPGVYSKVRKAIDFIETYVDLH